MKKVFTILFFFCIILSCSRKQPIRWEQQQQEATDVVQSSEESLSPDYQNLYPIEMSVPELEEAAAGPLKEKMESGIEAFRDEDPNTYYSKTETVYHYFDTPYGFVLLHAVSMGTLHVNGNTYRWGANDLYYTRGGEFFQLYGNWGTRPFLPDLISIDFDGEKYEIKNNLGASVILTAEMIEKHTR